MLNNDRCYITVSSVTRQNKANKDHFSANTDTLNLKNIGQVEIDKGHGDVYFIVMYTVNRLKLVKRSISENNNNFIAGDNNNNFLDVDNSSVLVETMEMAQRIKNALEHAIEVCKQTTPIINKKGEKF